MKKTALVLSLALIFSGSVFAQAGDQQTTANPGMVPGDLFYPVESFVEGLEVKIAGLVGGPDFKAKAIANNADERLAEAQAIAEKRPDKASELVQRYQKEMNKSQKLVEETGNRGLSEKMNNITEKNVKALEDVKKKVPEHAKNSIEKVIQKSRKKAPGLSEKGKKDGGQKEKMPQRPQTGENSSLQGNTPDTGKTAEKKQKSLENASEGLNTSSPVENGSGSGVSGSGKSEEVIGGTGEDEENPLGGNGENGSLLP